MQQKFNNHSQNVQWKSLTPMVVRTKQKSLIHLPKQWCTLANKTEENRVVWEISRSTAVINYSGQVGDPTNKLQMLLIPNTSGAFDRQVWITSVGKETSSWPKMDTNLCGEISKSSICHDVRHRLYDCVSCPAGTQIRKPYVLLSVLWLSDWGRLIIRRY